MEYRLMGQTGLKVSELCLGAMTLGRETPEDESYALLDRFVEAGGNFIDTADVYSQGTSETIVGRWLRQQPRDDFVIATKVRFPMGDAPNAVGLSRKHILAGIDASLRRLQTDYVDLYQIHAWDPATPLAETLSTLNDLVRAGKVRYIGVSNFAAWQLQKALDLSSQHGWERFTCLQPQYNLLTRSPEWELLPVCENEGLGVIPWSPLRGGWLSGRYRRGMERPPSGSRVETASKENWGERWAVYANEHTWHLLDVLFAIADEQAKSVAQVALNWVLHRPGVTAPIIGVRTMHHLEDNLGATGWQLTAEQVARLDEASAQPLPYPYDFLADSQARR